MPSASSLPLSPPPTRRIVICADDYGFAPGVNRAIAELMANRRLNATSVMVGGEALDRDAIATLNAATRANPDAAIGLHVTLTAPFAPRTLHFAPLDGGHFLPLGRLLARALAGRLDADIFRAEISTQIDAFTALFDRTPDFVDGHQHVQLFPGIRDGFIAAVKARAPQAWVRQCGAAVGHAPPLSDLKATLLESLSTAFRKRAAAQGVTVNPAFAGIYDFSPRVDFGSRVDRFIASLPDGGVMMCHPGFVDAALERLDPVTAQREREYAFFASPAFTDLLRTHHVTLANNPADAKKTVDDPSAGGRHP